MMNRPTHRPICLETEKLPDLPVSKSGWHNLPLKDIRESAAELGWSVVEDIQKTNEWGATAEDRRMLGAQGICWMD